MQSIVECDDQSIQSVSHSLPETVTTSLGVQCKEEKLNQHFWQTAKKEKKEKEKKVSSLLNR